MGNTCNIGVSRKGKHIRLTPVDGFTQQLDLFRCSHSDCSENVYIACRRPGPITSSESWMRVASNVPTMIVKLFLGFLLLFNQTYSIVIVLYHIVNDGSDKLNNI
jgi:hypothetical protein